MSDTNRRAPWSMEAIMEWAEELGADGEHRGTDLLDLYAKMRVQRDELRKVLETVATWWGGPDHHRDDCPTDGGCEDCLMSDTVNAVLAASE